MSSAQMSQPSGFTTEDFEIAATTNMAVIMNENGIQTPLDVYYGALSIILDSDCFKSKETFLIIYLHHSESAFSKNFLQCLSDQQLESFRDKFALIGFDVGDYCYRNALINGMVNRPNLRSIAEAAQNRKSAAFFLNFDKEWYIICMTDKPNTFAEFRIILNFINEGFCSADENNSSIISKEKSSEESVTSYLDFQQRMSDYLGNRDYDVFQQNQLDNLRGKIAFALFGFPDENQGENGYTKEQNEELNKMYDIILETNNEFSEYENQVVISIVFVCLLPLESSSDNDFNHLPVFTLRKCRDADNPCKVVIDHMRRVYQSWNEYLKENKLMKCWMIVPRHGRYEDDHRGIVKLDKVPSPACDPTKQLIKSVDVTSTVVGIGSTAVAVASAIPAITIAPVALTSAAIAGAGVGIYTLLRSAYSLVDRYTHKESVNITNSEARGAYLTIAGATLGAAGTGASAILSKAVSKGAVVGTASRVTVNALNVANLGVNFISVSNSTFEVFWRYLKTGEVPDSLTVLQLSSSLVFFTHSVYNFKSANTIIEESQTNTISRMKEMLENSKQKKSLRRMLSKATKRNNGDVQRGRAEVISRLITVPNKSKISAILCENYEQLDEMGIGFSKKNGKILFKGAPVDVEGNINYADVDYMSFFKNLKYENNVPKSTTYNITSTFSSIMTIQNFNLLRNFISGVVDVPFLSNAITDVLISFLRYNGGDRIFGQLRRYLISSPSQTIVNNAEFMLAFLKDYCKKKDLKTYESVLDVCCKLLRCFSGSSDEEVLKRLIEFAVKNIIGLFIQQKEAKQVKLTKRLYLKSRCNKCSGFYFTNNIRN